MRRGREGGLRFAGGSDDAPYRLDPFAPVVDASAGVDGAEDDIGIGLGLIGMFDEQFGGEAQVLAAAFVETQGARVAVDGVVIREIVLRLNQVGVAPIDEGLFHVCAVGVMAYGAFAGVAFESGEIGRFVAVRTAGFVGVAVEGCGDEAGSVSAGDDFGETYRLGLALGAGLVFALGLGRLLGNYLGERGGDENHVGGGWRKRVGFQLRLLLQL